jgi:indolepyruvate ferredoxin oxidoreductase beta subunit
MSQRGGSVVTQVRFGKHVYAPLAQAGEVDVLIALEELEALRYASYLKENGILLMCNCRIEPTASDGGIYPQSIRTQLEQKYYVYYMEEIPLRDKTLNVRMVGAAAGCLGFSREDGIKALEQNVAAEFLEKDKKAFLEGWEFYEQTQKSPAEWRVVCTTN